MNKITGKQLKEMLEAGEELIIIDLRNDEDYALGHIPKAMNFPLNAVAHEVEEIAEDKDTKICVYCYSGNRSSKAGMMLDYLNYTNVYNLGGIENWNYELEK